MCGMRRSFILVFCLGVVVWVSECALAQGDTGSPAAETGVVLTKLVAPVYPPLARQARITGDVKVQVSIGKDGSVRGAELISGHPMLAQAAIESAKSSTFECVGCSEAVTSYVLEFAFELRHDGDCCNAYSRPPDVTQSKGWIKIAAPASCICDPSADIRRVRGAKCLYLWRCSSR
jgi:TonB family protein